jgi:hypothetical protein
MWSDIKSLNTKKFTENDVAVIYGKNVEDFQVNYEPIAVGRILTTKMPKELKSKAVCVEHYMYDGLWYLGNKEILDEMIDKDAADAGKEEMK